MAKGKASTPAQGAEGSTKLIEHVVTQEDLDKNPELVEAGVQVGETIQIPENSDTSAETKPSKAKKAKGYKVAEGKSFRDKDNFDKVYNEGEKLPEFSEDRIDHLLSIGYIEEA